MCKTCPTKKESYFFSPKVLGKLCLTFQANSSHSFKSFFDRIHFLWACLHLNAAFFSNLRIVSSLADGGIPALTFIFYPPICSWRILIWSIIFRFCRTDVFDDCPWFYFLLSTAKSPILFFICLHIVALEYFPDDLILNFDADIASLLIILGELFAMFLSFLTFLCTKNIIYKIALLIL